MKKIKRSFLLTEILVCLSLMGLLLGITAFWQSHIGKVQGRDAVIHRILSEENIFYKRLRKVYMDLCEEVPTRDDELAAFLFNRGITKNPSLSGIIRGGLLHDREEGLLKLRLSNPRLSDFEDHVLLTNVTSLEYRNNDNGTIELSITRGEDKPFKERQLTYFFLKDEIF